MKLRLALGLALLCACRKHSPGDPARQSAARIAIDNDVVSVVLSDMHVDLPAGEVSDAATPIYEDAGGNHLGFRNSAGEIRHVHHIGTGLYLGARTPGPMILAPDHVYRALYDEARNVERRVALANDMLRSHGYSGLEPLLLESAPSPNEGWEKMRALVPPSAEHVFVPRLESLLETSNEWAVARAVRDVDLTKKSLAPHIAARARELALSESPIHRREAAALLRATLQNDEQRAGTIACLAVERHRLVTRGSDDEAFRSAVLLALAATKEPCPALAASTRSMQMPFHPRCRDGRVVPHNESARVDDVKCTPGDLPPIVRDAKARPPSGALVPGEQDDWRLYLYGALTVRDIPLPIPHPPPKAVY